jgi:hypothetical protein
MDDGQITTLSLFRFTGFKNRYWAFAMMGRGPWLLRGTPGLQFYKLLGSGGGNGFSTRPNFGLYALLGVWENEAAASRFFAGHRVFRGYVQHAAAVQTVYLRATAGHGTWDGFGAFETTGAFDPAAPTAVLTRAAIRWRYIRQFWKHVGPVSRDIEGRPGLRYAVGVGELPFVALATFSLWETGSAMLDYAYRRKRHAGAVRETREKGWFSEELFVRFTVERMEGHGVINSDPA